MKVLLVEPIGSGHHMGLYVRHVMRKLKDDGCKVSLLTTRSAVAHPSFQLLRKEFGDDIDLHFLPESPLSSIQSPLLLFGQQLKSWFILRREFGRLIARVDIDVIYVPTVDWVAKAIELLGSPFRSVPFVALYMAPKHHRKVMGLGSPSRQDWFYDKLFSRLLRIRCLHKLLVIDEYFFEYCKSSYGQLSEKVQYIPDFGEIHGEGTKEECREALGIPKKAAVLLIYGSLTKRKGIVQLINVLSSPWAPRELIVIIAGKPNEEIQAFLESPFVQRLRDDGRVILRLNFHDDSGEYLVFTAADFVWLGYVAGFYGSSGVLYKAVSAGLLVVAMKQGLIGRLVKQHELGVTVDPENGESVCQGLCRALTLVQCNTANRGKRYFFMANHTNICHSEVVSTTLFDANNRYYEK